MNIFFVDTENIGLPGLKQVFDATEYGDTVMIFYTDTNSTAQITFRELEQLHIPSRLNALTVLS